MSGTTENSFQVDSLHVRIFPTTADLAIAAADDAAEATIEGPIETACLASFPRRQSHASLYLDADSASLLGPKT